MSEELSEDQLNNIQWKRISAAEERPVKSGGNLGKAAAGTFNLAEEGHMGTGPEVKVYQRSPSSTQKLG